MCTGPLVRDELPYTPLEGSSREPSFPHREEGEIQKTNWSHSSSTFWSDQVLLVPSSRGISSTLVHVFLDSGVGGSSVVWVRSDRVV